MEHLARRISELNESKGFRAPHTISETGLALEKLALIHSEVSEIVEAIRIGDADAVAEECADVFIRMLHFTYGLGIDIEAEIERKHAKNAERPYMHGKLA